jgi:hypothetical protein
LVKKTKMKIQNKYVLRTIISEFLYFKKKVHGFNMVTRLRPRRGCDIIARPKTRGSGMMFGSDVAAT